jgi:hypothetical protein
MKVRQNYTQHAKRMFPVSPIGKRPAKWEDNTSNEERLGQLELN